MTPSEVMRDRPETGRRRAAHRMAGDAVAWVVALVVVVMPVLIALLLFAR